MEKEYTIALTGNPNSGKSTIFNKITGIRQHIGNYPGVTVEKKEGYYTYKNHNFRFVDLPGIYSLSPYSVEEIVTRDFLINKKPDVVIDIVDSTNLERNLYLATQLIQLKVPLVLVFNMWDMAEKRGFLIDYKFLSTLLGVPIVPTVGIIKRDIDTLLDTICDVVDGKISITPTEINYGDEIEEEIKKLSAIIEKIPLLTSRCPIKWTAIKLLENDVQILNLLEQDSEIKKLLIEQIIKSREHLKKIFGDDPEIAIADKRYGFISGACMKSVTLSVEYRHDISDKIDEILIHKLFGLPIFFLLMWLLFQITFKLGQYPMELLDLGFVKLGAFVSTIVSNDVIRSLLVDGVIGGVGGVLIFLPNILLLFLGIAILEDSGYMARAAFIMDKIMSKIGLQGKSCIPMLIGFGCNIPAIMATRTLENKRNRIITIMAIPFMSCGARLPVYALLIGTFFSKEIAGNVLFSIYLIGVLMGIVTSILFNKFIFKGESPPFIMELPPYRVPTVKGMLIHIWNRAWMYLKKAGTVILAFSVGIWFLCTFPQTTQYSKDYNSLIKESQKVNDAQKVIYYKNQRSLEKLENTFAGKLGHLMIPLLKPIGLGSWKIGVALFAGFSAKEVIVATLGTLYSIGETGSEKEQLKDALQRDSFFSPLVAYVFMIFTLLYIPCLSAVAVIRAELGGWKWAIIAVVYTVSIAWVVSFLTYGIGRLFLYI